MICENQKSILCTFSLLHIQLGHSLRFWKSLHAFLFTNTHTHMHCMAWKSASLVSSLSIHQQSNIWNRKHQTAQKHNALTLDRADFRCLVNSIHCPIHSISRITYEPHTQTNRTTTTCNQLQPTALLGC